MNSIKNKILNAGLILFSVVLVIILLEMILRFTHYNMLITKYEEFRYYYTADLNKGYDIKPNVGKFQSNVDEEVYFPIWSNTLGCFDEPYKGESDYILLLGDSFVHGHAPFADKWGSQLEKLLGYRVLKCGVDSYGTKQEFLKGKEIIKMTKKSPRLIVVGYFWPNLDRDYIFPNQTVIDGYLVNQNELKDVKTGEMVSRRNLEEKFGFFSTGPLIKIKNFIKRESIIGRFIISAVKDNIMGPAENNIYNNVPIAFLDFPWIENAWQDHFKNIQLIQSLAAQNGAQLLIVIIPTREQVYPFLFGWKSARLDPQGPNKKLIAFFNRTGIGYMDLLPLFEKYADQRPRKFLSSSKDLYWRYDGHWNIKGNHLVGLLVAKYILENNLIPIIHKDEKLILINQKLQELQSKSSPL
ncbi:MAG: hypothetical protein ACLPT6_04095 [Desulfobaccales bacterium]